MRFLCLRVLVIATHNNCGSCELILLADKKLLFMLSINLIYSRTLNLINYDGQN